jgi:hypothetical protein
MYFKYSGKTDHKIGSEGVTWYKKKELNKEGKKEEKRVKDKKKRRQEESREAIALRCSCCYAYELKPVWPSGTKLFLLYILVGSARRDRREKM